MVKWRKMAGIIQSVFSKEQPNLYNLSISKLKLEKGKLKQEHSYKLNNVGIIVQESFYTFSLKVLQDKHFRDC